MGGIALSALALCVAAAAPGSDYSKPELGEELPGGAATSRTPFDRDAFSQPAANLSFDGRTDFVVGNTFFRRTWVTAP